MASKSDPLKELLLFVKLITGEEGLKLFKELMKYDDISEEQLSEILGMKVNDVRRILYKLEDYGLVRNYKVKADEGNQYIYYWYIDRESLDRNLLKLKKEVLEKLKIRYENEEDIYFYCPRCGLRFSYEDAADYGFNCPRCDEPLESVDDNIYKKILKTYIKRIEQEIENESKRINAR